MGTDGAYVALGLKVWKAQIERAEKLFGSLSSEEVQREIAPGRKQTALLVGTSQQPYTTRCCRCWDWENGSIPEFDAAFVSNADKSQAATPSHEQVRQAWNAVNSDLQKGIEGMSWSDWLLRHTAVSEGDFAKDTSRNRFAILLSRTNHLSYHLGQAVLGLKGSV